MPEVACAHCGTPCNQEGVVWNGKSFCCHGCKAVYEILHASDLKQYYEIEQMPGIRIVNPPPLKKFEFLDNEEIASQLADFRDDTITRITLMIPAIHCASCIWLLEHLDSLHPGVISSQVNFTRKQLHVSFRHAQLSLRSLVELLASIHYVPEITLEDLDKKKPDRSHKRLLIKIGIAAFSFMNIMLYSFPQHVPGGDLLEQDFKHLFGWLSFILILPVVFYSASDYYIASWKGLKNKLINIDIPISLGILALFLQSSAEVFKGNGIGYLDSLSGLIFFLLIGKWYQGKTYFALSFERDYRSYFPIAVTKLDGNSKTIVPIRNLVKGDHILIRNQELIPTDAILVKGRGNIDYSFVTGEALPVPKETGSLLFAGGRQTGSSIVVEVTRAVDQSYLTQLWNQKNIRPEASTLNNHINTLSHYFTILLLIIAFTAFFYWVSIDLNKAVYVFSSVLIIGCPCALALSVPFAFGSTMRAFGRRGFYLRKAEVIEQLHRANTVVFDKTGTITINREVEVQFQGEPLTADESRMVKSLTQHSSHPLSVAVSTSVAGDVYTPDSYEEIPSLGISGKIGETRINIGAKQFVTGIPEEESQNESRVHVSINNRYKGYFSIANVYREGLQELLNQLRNHYELHLISGDNPAEKERLESFFGKDASIYFNQTPTDKKAYISNLRANGKNVMMVGDGLNDAGALSASQTGITVADDVFSFSPACDAIMTSEMFGQLHRFLRFSHRSFSVIRANFAISLIYNITGLSFAVSGLLSPLVAAIMMPLSSVTVVAFATLAISRLASRHLPEPLLFRKDLN